MGVGPVGRAGGWNGEGEGGEGGEGGGGRSVGTVYVCLMNRSPLRGRAACSQCFVVTQRPLYRESWAREEGGGGGDEQKKKKKKGGGGRGVESRRKQGVYRKKTSRGAYGESEQCEPVFDDYSVSHLVFYTQSSSAVNISGR